MERLELAEVISKESFFEGQRVLLDFMEQFEGSDYILVGNTNHGFVAITSENHSSPNYEPRSFRFNIGALHQYVLTDESRVKYADELKSGNTVLIGSKDGFRKLPIARIKKEIRPFVKLCCKHGETIISVILQDEATTILFGENGVKLLSEVQVGDKVLVMPWGKASHLGKLKEEFCEES
ncbi:MAG TPA: 3-dehydroquinate synthase II [Clostridia bacterium]|nr:3-dehydroquinate synthase II [Clostridia bacterium]